MNNLAFEVPTILVGILGIAIAAWIKKSTLPQKIPIKVRKDQER